MQTIETYIMSPNDFVPEFVEPHIGARVFGKMMEKAFGIIKHYHSDIYHDSLQLQDVVKEFLVDYSPQVWGYGIRETGTTWLNDTDSVDIFQRAQTWSDQEWYLCRLSFDAEKGNVYFSMST